MLKKYTKSLEPYVPTILRVFVGLTFLLHGFSKWQNIAGFAGFLGSLGVPFSSVAGPLIGILELAGGLLLILGIGTRWLGLLFAIEMIIATLLVKIDVGFIAPQGQPGVGYELDLLLFAGAFALLVLGSGAISVETNILKREL